MQFDLDDSGEIETKELLALGQARRKLGQKSGAWTEEKNAKLVKNMDTDGDGTVNEKEFSGYFDKSLTKDEAEFGEIVAQFMEVAKECRQQKQAKRAAIIKDAAEQKKENENSPLESPAAEAATDEVVDPKSAQRSAAAAELAAAKKAREEERAAKKEKMERA